jgi:hypothetical protein
MYELAIGGERTESAATVYQNLHTLDVSENPTSVNSWTATIPYTNSLDDELLTAIYVYFDGEMIFAGILESIESNYDDSKTTLGGRGSAVELAYQTDSITYSNTTVYDALIDYWTNSTLFDAQVLPPNRDYLDVKRVSTAGLRRLFSNDENADHRIYDYHYDIANSRLFPQQLNFTEDVDASASTISTDGTNTSSSEYSLDTAVRFDGDGGSYLDYAYAIPDDPDYENDNYRWNVRLQSSSISDATLDFYIDGTHVRTWNVSSTTLSHQWVDVLNDSRLSTVNSAPGAITSDPTFRLEVAGLASGEYIDIDAETVTDETFGTYTLPSSTNADGVYEGPEWYPDDVLIDGETDSDFSFTDLAPSTDTDRLGLFIATEAKLPELTAEIRNKDTGNVVTETVTHSDVADTHLFDFEFANMGGDFAVRLRPDGQRPDTQSASGETARVNVARIEAFAVDPTQLVTIDDAELNGTKFEILESLCERGKFRFATTDYANDIVQTFHEDTIKPAPGWTITQESRQLDYTDYANSVTVHGKTQSDGTVNTATVSNQDEITVVGREVSAFEKNPDVVTQSEVDTRAERLLSEKIAAKDESGSLDVTPQQVVPGYTYPVSTWGEAFDYEGAIGVNSLSFDGADGAPDYVEFPTDSIGFSDVFTFEFLLSPRNLAELGDDNYVGICAGVSDGGTPTFNDFVTLYGDGSVGVGFGQVDDSDPYRGRSVAGIVNAGETQRLSIVWGPGADSDASDDGWELYIDGILKDRIEPNNSWSGLDVDEDIDRYKLGVDADEANPYDGGMDDVRLFYEGRSQATIKQYAYEDILRSNTADLRSLPFYLRFDDRSDTTTAVVDSGTVYTPRDGTITGATYAAAYGRVEELQYTLGTDGNLRVKFDISGRVDTELIQARSEVRRNRRNL